MKWILLVITVTTLCQRIRPQGCGISGQNMHCQNMRVERGPLPMAGNKLEVTRMFFTRCTVGVVSKEMFNEFTNVGSVDFEKALVNTIEPDAFKALPNLRILNIGFNKITELKTGTFGSLDKLEELWAYANRIGGLPDDMNGMKSLTSLHFSGNLISEVKPGTINLLTNLESLGLEGNKLSEIPKDIAALKKLQLLNLGGNKIAAVDKDLLAPLIHLNKLTLKANQLTQFPPVDTLANLKLLDLDHNKILSTKPEAMNSLINLEMLKLSVNGLRVLPPSAFKNMGKLETLYLQYNLISHLAEGLFQPLTNLQELNLGHNIIVNIDWEVFTPLTNLIILRLNHNELTSIPDEGLRQSTKLKEFYVNDNNIVSFNFAYFMFLHKPLERIFLNHNQWKCSTLLQGIVGLDEKLFSIMDNNSEGEDTVQGISCMDSNENGDSHELFEESRIFATRN